MASRNVKCTAIGRWCGYLERKRGFYTPSTNIVPGYLSGDGTLYHHTPPPPPPLECIFHFIEWHRLCTEDRTQQLNQPSSNWTSDDLLCDRHPSSINNEHGIARNCTLDQERRTMTCTFLSTHNICMFTPPPRTWLITGTSPLMLSNFKCKDQWNIIVKCANVWLSRRLLHSSSWSSPSHGGGGWWWCLAYISFVYLLARWQRRSVVSVQFISQVGRQEYRK